MIMKKNQTAEPTLDEMRDHYDFDYSQSRPNRFATHAKVGRLRPTDVERREREAQDKLPMISRSLPLGTR
jgi:hypothetical protein